MADRLLLHAMDLGFKHPETGERMDFHSEPPYDAEKRRNNLIIRAIQTLSAIMLIWFVVLYLLVSIGIGLYAATRVQSAKDFTIPGRHLPLPVVTATVFATWFGAEAIFGVSATFVKEGLHGVVADPFGASLCLIIAGIFFSRKLYKLNVLTLGDYSRLRYNRTVEILTTLCIVIAYLGWVSAQIKALGLLFNVVTDGAISQTAGMILGAAHRPHLHHAGRHALGGHSRFRADGRHHGRHAVHRLADFRPDRRRHAGDSARLGGRQARFLPRARPLEVDRLHRCRADHDARLDSAAGRLPAHHLGAARPRSRCGARYSAAASISALPSCRCSSPTRQH